MHFLQGVIIALNSIWTNKLRSFLTLIGVAIGVLTVVAVVAVIDGMNSYVAELFSSMGSSTFVVDKFGVITNQDEFFKALKRKDLTVRDLRALRESCDLCDLIGGGTPPLDLRVKYRSDYVSDCIVKGVTSNYVEISDVKIDYGRSFSPEDDEHNRAVTVVGPDVAENLFPGVDPIGRDIKIGGYYFRIVGVGERRGSFVGVNMDNWAIIPLTAYDRYFGGGETITIFARARKPGLLQQAQDQALSQSHSTCLYGYDYHLLCRPGRGRDRDNEHHAGGGHRENPGGWDPQGPGSQKEGYPVAVLG